METDLKKYLEEYEQSLTDSLYEECYSLKILDSGRIPKSDDIISWWKDNAPLYMEDAVREYNDYPEVVLIWVGLLGMAVAKNWDSDWKKYKTLSYKDYYGSRGFDDMDENIMNRYLNINPQSDSGEKLYNSLKSLANTAITLIKHENIEECTSNAFYILARTIRCMFLFGAAIQFHKLGYKMRKVNE